MLAALTWLSMMNGFGQPHAQWYTGPMLNQQPYSPPPIYATPLANVPEIQYAPPVPMAPQQFAQPPQPMASQVQQMPQPEPSLAAPQEQIPKTLELPPFAQEAALLSTGTLWSQPPAVEVGTVPQQLDQPQTNSENHALQTLPGVELRPKPAAKLEFTKDPSVLGEQRAAYGQKEEEYLQHLHSEFDEAKKLVLDQQEEDMKAINERIDLQVSNQEELLELEFERQDAILAQHFETRNQQLASTYEKERPALEERSEEGLNSLLAEMEHTHAEGLELIEVAAKAESKKFDEAKDLLQEYDRDRRSSESGITSDLNMHENNYENILKHKMSQLQSATSEDSVN